MKGEGAGERVKGEVEGEGEMVKYGPTCLIYGKTDNGRPIYVQCSHPTRLVVKIITVYEPEAERWMEFRVRRQ